MDENFVNFIYFLTVGVPPRNMSSNHKLVDAINKILLLLLGNNCHQHKNILFSEEHIHSLHDKIDNISLLYKQIVIKYFTERKQFIELSNECRNMKQILYESGSIKEVQLLYPSYKNSVKNHSMSLSALNGNGSGAIVNIEKNKVDVVFPGKNYRFTDNIVGFHNNSTYIFKIISLDNTTMDDHITPTHWNIPLHTQIYRFFFPHSYDTEQIKKTKILIETKGIEYVIDLYVSTYLFKYNKLIQNPSCSNEISPTNN
tara:strand:+ start:25942 stop:26712 length:771 start_codon:yes stop_codon:yes gene_type:complete